MHGCLSTRRFFSFIKNHRSWNLKCYSSSVHILGIETSCDDTGCAIINGKGEILGQTLQSQHLIHLRNGGIIPDIAQDLHRQNMEPVVTSTLQASNFSINDITAIAVTVKPGLPLSLAVGMKYAKHLARKHNKPLIPIHHMKAHALAARMQHDIYFPFLVLLISGPHCMLALANDVDNFVLLGESMDTGPGEVFDKVARQMKLRNLPEYSQMCGGKAIEVATSKAKDPHSFVLSVPLGDYRDCNFSFNGLKTAVMNHLRKKELEHVIQAHALIPEINDLCAAFLKTVTRHLVLRTQRAMEYCQMNNLIPENRAQLVVSGGVASNDFIFKGLQTLCDEYNYQLYRPPHSLCVDNGVMIAWNGLEKWRADIDTSVDINTLDIEPDCPLGENIISDVKVANIATKIVELKLFD